MFLRFIFNNNFSTVTSKKLFSTIFLISALHVKIGNRIGFSNFVATFKKDCHVTQCFMHASKKGFLENTIQNNAHLSRSHFVTLSLLLFDQSGQSGQKLQIQTRRLTWLSCKCNHDA
jgi:hypothetical protein